eukprot:5065126-Prymnesium_polylepis.2
MKNSKAEILPLPVWSIASNQLRISSALCITRRALGSICGTAQGMSTSRAAHLAAHSLDWGQTASSLRSAHRTKLVEVHIVCIVPRVEPPLYRELCELSHACCRAGHGRQVRYRLILEFDLPVFLCLGAAGAHILAVLRAEEPLGHGSL